MDVQTDEQMNIQTEDRTDIQRKTLSVKSPDRRRYNFRCRYNRMYDEGPSTSAEAARREKMRRLAPAADQNGSGQEVQEADNTANVEAQTQNSAAGVIVRLSPYDKVVQLHFDEAYTNGKMRYSRTEDVLYGCGNNNIKKLQQRKSTTHYSSSLLLTCFSILISAIAITAYHGAPDELDRCLGIVEEAGLEVKAVVCDRSNANLHTMIKFNNGTYKRKRADGTVYTIYHLVDYIHAMHSFHCLMARSKRFDTSVVTRAHARKLSTSNHLKRRGACVINTTGSTLKR
uniref:Uncharacterized protein n=1 Tax=Glossina palpalis gambiensis TaxID=67801 RepID=A0A1B0C2L1_9MUSC